MNLPKTADAETAPTRRVADAARRLAVFDADDYLVLNPDIGSVDPGRHYGDQGVWEHRSAISAEKRTARLAWAVAVAPLEPLSFDAVERAYGALDRLSPTIHLPLAAGERESLVAGRIVAALEAAGLECRVEHGLPGPDHSAPLVLDAATLFANVPAEKAAERLRATVVVAAGFPAEPAFAAELPYLLAAGGVAAVELETYALFAASRIPALWFGAPGIPLAEDGPPDHPLVPGLSRAVRNAPPNLPWAQRAIDVLALEPASPARLAAWSRMVEGMTRFTTVYHDPPADLPTSVELRRYLYARSKVVLHLHEGPPTTLGALLASEVAGTGAVLLTEPSLPHRLLHPGSEYFEASARRMPALVDRLIHDADGPAVAAQAAASMERALATAFDPESLGLGLIDALLTVREGEA